MIQNWGLHSWQFMNTENKSVGLHHKQCPHKHEDASRSKKVPSFSKKNSDITILVCTTGDFLNLLILPIARGKEGLGGSMCLHLQREQKYPDRLINL